MKKLKKRITFRMSQEVIKKIDKMSKDLTAALGMPVRKIDVIEHAIILASEHMNINDFNRIKEQYFNKKH